MRVRAEKLGMCFKDGERVVEVFSGLNLDIESGSSLAIVGESGVGKSTLLYILGALEKPSHGEVFIGDDSYALIEKERGDIAAFRGKNIGFIFQFHHLLPEFNALENVAMPLLIRGVNFCQAGERAKELLTKVGLAHRFTHRPGELSGGEQQRVAVARALAASPGVVLADEPTGNLDQRTGGEVCRLLKQLQEEEKVTLIVATHCWDLARTMDQILRLTPQGLVKE